MAENSPQDRRRAPPRDCARGAPLELLRRDGLAADSYAETARREEIAALKLRAEQAEAALASLQVEVCRLRTGSALPDTPVLCLHCEHQIKRCPKCHKAEWQITPDKPLAQPHEQE